MALRKIAAMIGSIAAIIVAGGAGALAGWSVVAALGWTGLGAAFAGLLVAMGVAVLMFAAGVVLLKTLRWLD